MLGPSRRGNANRAAARRNGARRRASAPRLEGLEDRLVLSTIAWNAAVAPAGGLWSVPSNWVGGVVPGSTDDAVIDLSQPGAVTVDADAAVNSVTTDADTNFTLTQGTFTVAADSTLAGAYTQTGGTLSGAGAFNVGGPLSWIVGAMSGTGATNANGGLAINPTATTTFT